MSGPPLTSISCEFSKHLHDKCHLSFTAAVVKVQLLLCRDEEMETCGLLQARTEGQGGRAQASAAFLLLPERLGKGREVAPSTGGLPGAKP